MRPQGWSIDCFCVHFRFIFEVQPNSLKWELRNRDALLQKQSSYFHWTGRRKLTRLNSVLPNLNQFVADWIL